jgi:hypothetical protein
MRLCLPVTNISGPRFHSYGVHAGVWTLLYLTGLLSEDLVTKMRIVRFVTMVFTLSHTAITLESSNYRKSALLASTDDWHTYTDYLVDWGVHFRKKKIVTWIVGKWFVIPSVRLAGLRVTSVEGIVWWLLRTPGFLGRREINTLRG